MTGFTSIADQLAHQAIELPSWAFGNSGTRFKVFATLRHAADHPGEARRRRQGERVHRARPEGRAAHPLGQGRRLRRPEAYAADLGVALGTINSNTFQDDIYKFGSLTHVDEVGAAQGDRSPLRVHRDHEPDRVPRSEDLAGRRHQLRRARATSAAARIGSPTAWRRSTTGSAQISGWCWSTSSSSRRSTTWTCPDWGTVVRPGRRPRRPGDGLPGHRSPRAGHQHRVHRRAAAAAGEAGLVRLQLPLLRRRRPDRRGRPIRSSCSGSCSR